MSASRCPITEANKKELKKIIRRCCKAANVKLKEIEFDIYWVPARDSSGSLLYINAGDAYHVKFSINTDHGPREFNCEYDSKNCIDHGKLLNDLSTDLMFVMFESKYRISSKLLKGEHSWSYHNDTVSGLAGLSQFWNVDKAEFDWHQYKKLAKPILAAEEKGCINSIFKTETSLFISSLPSGVVRMPFADVIDALRYEYGVKQAQSVVARAS